MYLNIKSLYKKNWDFLENSCRKGRLVHAYLFSGPKMTGKFDMAVEFAKLAAGIKKGVEDLAKGAHPDVVVVAPETEEKRGKTKEKSIAIGQIRKAKEQVMFFPYEARYKFLIVNQGDKMTSMAANSILKLMEEPSSDTIIVFIADNEDALFSTLRSRCQILRFYLRPAHKIEEILLEKKFDKNKVKQAARIAQGKIKLAEKLISDENFFRQALEEAAEFKEALKSGLTGGFDLAETRSKDKKALLENIDKWLWEMRIFLVKQIKEQADLRIQKKIFIIIK